MFATERRRIRCAVNFTWMQPKRHLGTSNDGNVGNT